METSLAISLAVCIFNSGLEYTLSKLFEKTSIPYNYNMVAEWHMLDKERVFVGDYTARDNIKLRRKLKKRANVKKQDAFQHLEGIQYKPQGLHSNSSRD